MDAASVPAVPLFREHESAPTDAAFDVTNVIHARNVDDPTWHEGEFQHSQIDKHCDSEQLPTSTIVRTTVVERDNDETVDHQPDLIHATKSKPSRSSDTSSEQSPDDEEQGQSLPIASPAVPRPQTGKPRLKRPRVLRTVTERERLRNMASRSALSSLRNISVEDRVTDRYIAALYALQEKFYRPFASHVQSIAKRFVVNPRELQRVYALAVIAKLAEQKPRDIERFSFRKILDGHRRYRGSVVGRAKVNQSVLKSRRRKIYRLKGVSIRDARETLSSASSISSNRNQQTFDVLNGEELIPLIREEAYYCDDANPFSPLDDDPAVRTGISGGLEDQCLAAVGELPFLESVPVNEVMRIAGKISAFAAVLQQAPHFVQTEKLADYLQKNHNLGNDEQNGGVAKELHGPSQLSYLTALYRLESLRIQAESGRRIPASHEGKFPFNRQDDLSGKLEIRFHPFVKRILSCLFSSVEELSENESQLSQFGCLIDSHKRSAIIRSSQAMQVNKLLAVMKAPDRHMATKLVQRFGSARRSIRTSSRDLEVLFGSKAEAKDVMTALHGHRENFSVRSHNPELSHVVAHVLENELNRDWVSHLASFSGVFGPTTASRPSDENFEGVFSLTPDERLSVYRAFHSDRDGRSPTSFAQFEASWGLFRQVCQRTSVGNTVAVTTTLLNEDKSGAEVLEWLAAESTEAVCLKAGISADDALRLQSYARTFVPSTPT